MNYLRLRDFFEKSRRKAGENLIYKYYFFLYTKLSIILLGNISNISCQILVTKVWRLL